jgi:hypothetical protein
MADSALLSCHTPMQALSSRIVTITIGSTNGCASACVSIMEKKIEIPAAASRMWT